MSQIKVLIVEDEVIIAHNLARILKKLDYQVVKTVTSGEDAIRATQKYLPDIILMDIVIQGKINGIQTAAEITKAYQIPVIYVTAYTDDAILQKIRHVGGYGFLVKPYKRQQLHAAIQLALGQHQRFIESQSQLQYKNHKLLLGSQEIAALGQQFFSCTHSHFLVLATLILRINSDVVQLSKQLGEHSTGERALIQALAPCLNEQDVAGWLTQTDLIFLSYMRTPEESKQWADMLKQRLPQAIVDVLGTSVPLHVGFSHSVPDDVALEMVCNRAYNSMVESAESHVMLQGS